MRMNCNNINTFVRMDGTSDLSIKKEKTLIALLRVAASVTRLIQTARMLS